MKKQDIEKELVKRISGGNECINCNKRISRKEEFCGLCGYKNDEYYKLPKMVLYKKGGK